MSPRAKPMKYSASAWASMPPPTPRSTTVSSYPCGTMARHSSMMSLGIGGEKTILMGTGRSFSGGGYGVSLWFGGQDHVGCATDRDHGALAVGDGGLSEGDAPAAAEDAALRDDVAAGGGEEAHVEVEGGLAHAAGGGRVQR